MRFDAQTLFIGLTALVVAALAVFVLVRGRSEPAVAEVRPAPIAVAAAEPAAVSVDDQMDQQVAAMLVTCKTSMAAEPPAADRPTATETRALTDCSSTDDYYGVDGRRDYVRARKCAFTEMGRPEGPAGPSGPGVLMMVYAKGQGVTQNIAYARLMACTAGYSAMDKVTMLEAVEAAATDPEANVDVCENYGSGWFGSLCAYQEAERRNKERDHRIARLQRGWPPARLAGWKTVLTNREAFVEARIDNEVDTSGTLRGRYIANEEGFIRDFEEGLLADLVRSQLSRSGPALVRADREMNRAYRVLMAEPVDDLTWPLPEDIRATQRQWLRHRDGWRRFAEAEWPGSGDAVVARLTAERRIMLACLTTKRPASVNCRRYQAGN